MVASPDGTKTALDPPFHVVLCYERAVRTEAFRKALEEECTTAPHTLSKALKEVMKDSEIKEIYFTSPLALAPHSFTSWKRNLDASSDDGAGKVKKWAKGAQKGKAKGKGNGEGKKG